MKQDFKKAFDEFVKIEKDMNGYHYAQRMIGDCYEYGQGTEEDMVRAAEWYGKSAEQGNRIAMNNLGYCYSHGKGVDEDKTKAYELYEQSALLGNSYGMFNVGVFYEKGVGVTRNLNNAKEWYAKSAAQCYDDAQTKLDKLNAPPAAESDDE